MKVGICVTTHRSKELRPKGKELLDNFFNSFRNSNFLFDYKIYVSDNESSIKYEYPLDLNLDISYIKDQSIEGITGAWNNALNRAYEDGCDILWNFNDDIELNNSMNSFIRVIQDWLERDTTLFGPTSDNGGHGSPNTRSSVGIGVTKLNLSQNSWMNLPNGFSFAFTRKFYEKYRNEKENFFAINHPLNGGDGKWGGQEGYFGLKINEGLKAVIVNSCWLKHYKLRQWPSARNKYKND